MPIRRRGVLGTAHIALVRGLQCCMLLHTRCTTVGMLHTSASLLDFNVMILPWWWFHYVAHMADVGVDGCTRPRRILLLWLRPQQGRARLHISIWCRYHVDISGPRKCFLLPVLLTCLCLLRHDCVRFITWPLSLPMILTTRLAARCGGRMPLRDKKMSCIVTASPRLASSFPSL